MPLKPKHAEPSAEKSDPRRPTKAKVIELFRKHPDESAYDIGLRAGVGEKRIYQIAAEEGWGRVAQWAKLK